MTLCCKRPHNLCMIFNSQCPFPDGNPPTAFAIRAPACASVFIDSVYRQQGITIPQNRTNCPFKGVCCFVTQISSNKIRPLSSEAFLSLFLHVCKFTTDNCAD